MLLYYYTHIMYNNTDNLFPVDKDTYCKQKNNNDKNRIEFYNK